MALNRSTLNRTKYCLRWLFCRSSKAAHPHNVGSYLRGQDFIYIMSRFDPSSGDGVNVLKLDHSRRTWMPAYGISIQTVTTALLVIRLYSRFEKRGARAGADDVLICIGWFFGLVVTVLAVISKYRPPLLLHRAYCCQAQFITALIDISGTYRLENGPNLHWSVSLPVHTIQF